MPRPPQIPDGLRRSSHTVANTATQIFAASNDRVEAIIQNTGANIVFLGENNGVTTANGFPIAVGATIVLNTSDAIWGIVAAATEPLRVLETYDK